MSEIYKLQYTGEQIDSIISKSEKLAGIFGSDIGVMIEDLGGAEKGVYKFIVTQLATKTTLKGKSYGGKIESQSEFVFDSAKFMDAGFTVEHEGKTRSFYYAYEITTIDELIADIQNSFDKTFGVNQVKITVTTTDTGHIVTIKDGVPFHTTTVTCDDTEGNLLTLFNIPNGSTTAVDLNVQVGNLMDTAVFDEAGNYTITVNDTQFIINSNNTIQEVFDMVNTADIDVTVKYNNIDKYFMLERTTTGDGKNIRIEGADFWNILNISTSQAAVSGYNTQFTFIPPTGEQINNIRLAFNSFVYNNALITLLAADSTKTYVAVL